MQHGSGRLRNKLRPGRRAGHRNKQQSRRKTDPIRKIVLQRLCWFRKSVRPGQSSAVHVERVTVCDDAGRAAGRGLIDHDGVAE